MGKGNRLSAEDRGLRQALHYHFISSALRKKLLTHCLRLWCKETCEARPALGQGLEPSQRETSCRCFGAVAGVLRMQGGGLEGEGKES